ncbi:MAG TPA: DUF554 domain-containing protein [Magnetospirillaceae bacterium]|nr:DUF554 domain-containing protein [Magnetospirillaceae bacterium]
MIATLVNAAAIVLGTLVGLALRKGFSEKMQNAVFTAAGCITLVLGMKMAFETNHILALALALLIGAIWGTWMDVEGAVFRLGEFLKRRFTKGEEGSSFAFGFLNASVLYCVGSMALVGSFKAGVEGDYSLILTKSVLDGFVSVLFAGAMGVGVAFSAISVLVYQGALTLLSARIAHLVSETMISELTAAGGILVLMIGLNLLDLRKVRTGDFLPALFVMIVLVLLIPYVPFL